MNLRETAEALVRSATQLLGYQVAAGNANREKSKKAYGLILEAHMAVTGAIGSALTRNDGVRSKIVGHSQRQIVLIASFIQGLNIAECAISEGYYVQAAALLRQELETIAALEELKSGKRADQRTPNVKHVPWSLGRLYSDLSKAAHAADHDVLQQVLAPDHSLLPEDTIGVTMTAQFRKNMAWRMMGFHVALLLLLAVHLDAHYKMVSGTGLNEMEVAALRNAQQMLLDEGWLETAS
jgi:hypothetical protein